MHTTFTSRMFSFTDIFSDSRGHGQQGPTRNVRFPRVASHGGGAIAKSEDGRHCVVAGKESLRILHFLQPSQSSGAQPHKTVVGRGGYRIESSRNFWDGSGLKIDSASTDVAWGRANFSNKILTSARNGELIMWDINRTTPHKYERRSKLHIRSINTISISPVVPYYCITGSTDGDLRVWDLRDITKSLRKIHHPISVRSAVFSPISERPLQVLVGLDNGSIYRWDLQMAQRGQLDRLPVAHSGPIMSLDWCSAPARLTYSSDNTSSASGLGWFASGGLDRSVKVWNLMAPNSHAHISHKPTYSLHPSFPVRRVVWRPGYECELAVVSNEAFGTGSHHDLSLATAGSALSHPRRTSFAPGGDGVDPTGTENVARNSGGDPVEIWDVRRRWIAKWSVMGSAVDGGVTDLVFTDPHAIWTQHSSGMFSQIDLKDCVKPIDAVPRVAITWDGSGSFAFVSDRISPWEIPYDDVHITTRQLLNERKFGIKALGDDSAIPESQSMGAYSGVHFVTDQDSFSRLARSFAFEGTDRKAICRLNAEAGFKEGKDEAAHAWLFLASLLTDILPESPKVQPDTPTKGHPSPLPQPATPLSAVASTFSFPHRNGLSSLTSPPSEISTNKTHLRHNSKSSSPLLTPDTSGSRPSRRVTPSSSATSSPRYATVTLPPASQRQPSHLSSRPSVHRRSSSSIAPGSPSAKSTRSLRHVGEGALDDSDSSEEGGDSGDRGDVSRGEEKDNRRSLSPHSGLPTPPLATSSPILTGQQEEDESNNTKWENASSSPRSTDSESSSVGSHPESRLGERDANHKKSRSRSLTVASLVATTLRRPLVKQESQSSIRTITACESSHRIEDRSQDHERPHTESLHTRQVSSHARTSDSLLSPEARRDVSAGCLENSSPFLTRQEKNIRDSEKKFRELGWEFLRGQLEDFADEGDVQMCALLSLLASQELHVNRKRMNRFLESYIEILTRLRLYTSAAYIRKYSGLEELGAMTRLETTVYTVCARCRKPCIYPIEPSRSSHQLKGGYAYCRTCHLYPSKCSICRLPVRTMLFHCSVCRHGGHRECYVRYYMTRPMINMPTSTLLMASRSRPSSELSGSDDDNVIGSDGIGEGDHQDHDHDHHQINRISGHPCAAGCGHICWAANIPPDYNTSDTFTLR